MMPTHQFGIEQTDIHTRMKWKKCMKCGQVMVERDDYFNMHCQAAQKEIEKCFELADKLRAKLAEMKEGNGR